MQMKRLIMAIGLMLALMPAIHAETNYLHLATADGWALIDLSKADRLYFKNGSMTVQDADGKVLSTYSQSALDKMYVDQSAGVVTPAQTSSEPAFTVSEDGRMVTLLGGGLFEVYALNGSRLAAIPGVCEGETIDLSALQPGVYVCRLGEYAIKCIVK